jgi:hypothetical protein
MRNALIYPAAAILILAAVFSISCGGGDSVNLVLNQEPGDCALSSQSAASIRCDGGAFAFEGSIITPNPCHNLKAAIGSVNKSSVEIVITAMSNLGEGGFCAECVGEIAFDGMLELPGACGRTLSIVYNGATIAKY